jgi:hypothetical protein
MSLIAQYVSPPGFKNSYEILGKSKTDSNLERLIVAKPGGLTYISPGCGATPEG